MADFSEKIALVGGLFGLMATAAGASLYVSTKADRSDLVSLKETVSGMAGDFKELKKSMDDSVKVSELLKGTYDRLIVHPTIVAPSEDPAPAPKKKKKPSKARNKKGS